MTRASLVVVMVAVAGAAAPGWAQVQQIIGGNAMDANPLVGSGGANKPVPGYVPVNGNDIITGNVSGLKYFHGRIPYRNQYEFGAPLGTSAISGFARQSAGASPTGVYTGQTTPYYLPSATVSGAGGAIAPRPMGSGFDSRYVPGTSASPLAKGYDPINALNMPLPVGQQVPYRRYDRLGTGEEDTASPLQPSGLWGLRSGMQIQPIKALKEISVQDIEKAEKLDREERERMERERTDVGSAQQARNDRVEVKPVDAAVGGPALPMDARVGVVRGMAEGDVYTGLATSLQKAGRSAETAPAGMGSGATGSATTRVAPLPGTFESTKIDPKTGQPILRPEIEKPTEWQSTDPSKPYYRPAKVRPIREESKETLQSGKKIEPIQTFKGKTPSLFNQFMGIAERQLKEGRYIDAAETYQEATRFSSDNPLPVVGRAHAQLAAGMYADAAADLKALLERRPELTAVRYDLMKFLPEKRLGFLQQDLSTLAYGRRGNPSASFLLAYISYQLGDNERVKKELSYWKGQNSRDPWPQILEKAWVEDEKK